MNISKYNSFYYEGSAAVFTVATGGTITTSGDYKIHTFNSSTNFVVSQLGTAPNDVVEYLVVAGGAGGGGCNNSTAGGGGAGGLLTNTGLSISVASYVVIVGTGGAGVSNANAVTHSTKVSDGLICSGVN